MSAALHIKERLHLVQQIRHETERDPALAQAVSTIKSIQSNRFKDTYADLLSSDTYGECADFFLRELYGDKDYAERDAQFARIASTLELTLPAKALKTIELLSELHYQTETLDQTMGKAWLDASVRSAQERYREAWDATGQHATRLWQLNAVIEIGGELAQLTRIKGLKTLLHLMKRPAQLAGVASLQTFLEDGFTKFRTLAKQENAAGTFLSIIRNREAAWIENMRKST